MARIRPATPADLEAMLAVYAQARVFMARTGNPHQWGDGHPRRALLEEDIAQGHSYVMEGEDAAVHAVFFYAPGPDPTYAVIEDGTWRNDKPYGVIHRIAGDGQLKGVLSAAVDFCQRLCPELRMDTHHDNRVMQAALERAGFVRCGIIHLENGDPRIAYQKEGEHVAKPDET